MSVALFVYCHAKKALQHIVGSGEGPDWAGKHRFYLYQPQSTETGKKC